MKYVVGLILVLGAWAFIMKNAVANQQYGQVEVEYDRDIRPIFMKHCASCHIGSLSYDVAVAQKDKIYQKFVKQGQMPPRNQSRPTPLEVELVKVWIETGTKK